MCQAVRALGSNETFTGRSLYDGSSYSGIDPQYTYSLNDIENSNASYKHPDGLYTYDSTGSLFNDGEEKFLNDIAQEINVPGGEYDPASYVWNGNVLLAPNNTCSITTDGGQYLDTEDAC